MSVNLCVAIGWMVFLPAAGLAADAPLADAVEKMDRGRIDSLLEQDIDVNQAQVDGMTALHWAAYHVDLKTAKALVTARCNVKAANRYGVTPLSLACTNGSASIVDLLLEAGADPNTTLRGGETALMTAARTGKLGPVKSLLSHKADVNAKEKSGQTALMWAAAEGHAIVVNALLEAGAEFRTPLPSGFNALFFAIREGRTEVVQVLLKAGADVNEGLRPKGKPSGKSPNAGTSPLILAIENGHFELGESLLMAGANPNDERTGFTPLHTLCWVRKPNRGDGDDGQPPPMGSGKLTSLNLARELVRHGANVNLQLEQGSSGRGKINMTGATAFLLASKTADLAYMRLLVELGANPLLPNKDGCTPLMAAAGLGTLAPTEEAGTEPEAIAAVAYLLTLGAEVNTVDYNGETAMHGAAYKSLPKMVQLLADKGAKIDLWNQKNKYGWTPLLIAEGYRPGNFKPSADTITAIHGAMRAAGVTPPPPTIRPGTMPMVYD